MCRMHHHVGSRHCRIFVMIFIAVNCCVLYMIAYSLTRPAESINQSTSKNHGLEVCVIANVQNIQMAENIISQWPWFHHFFAVWDMNFKSIPNVVDAPPSLHTTSNFESTIRYFNLTSHTFLAEANNSTHADGWTIAYTLIRRLNQHCDYFFTLDDDLQWELTDTGSKWLHAHHSTLSNDTLDHTKQLSSILLEYLSYYKPAVTVFNWPYAESNYESIREFNNKYEEQIVQPATAFDNGCFLFHKSVVPFFIPLWLGSNFQAGFVLQWNFLNFFIPFTFPGHAIRFNGIKFHNPSRSRHHQFDSNPNYVEYLQANLKCNRKWGVETDEKDITWGVTPFTGNSYRYDDIVQLATFFNVSSTGIRDHPAILQQWNPQDIDLVEEMSRVHLKPDEFCTLGARAKLVRALLERAEFYTNKKT